MESQENQNGSTNLFVGIFRRYFREYLWHLFVLPPVTLTLLYLQGSQDLVAMWHTIQERPVLGAALVFGGLALSHTILGMRGYFQPKLVRYFGYKRIVNGCGIEDYHPRTPGPKTHQWTRFVNLAEPDYKGKIRILCITGAATFARRGAPLHDLIEQFEGSIEILLVAVEGRAYEQRIRELCSGRCAAEWGNESNLRQKFNTELEETRNFCLRLANKPAAALNNIEVRTYDVPAIFKMVFFGRYVWLQHYEPFDDVERSPAFVFRSCNGGIYSSLDRAFLNRWRMSEQADAHCNSRVLLLRTPDEKWSGKWAETYHGSGPHPAPPFSPGPVTRPV